MPKFVLLRWWLLVTPLLASVHASAEEGDEGPSEDSGPKLAIIVNKRNAVPAMAEKELEGIFLLERRFWVGSARITPVVRAPNTEMFKIFARRVLPKEAAELPELYDDRKNVIKTVDSDREAVAAVAQDPTAIAYVWEQSVTGAVRQVATIELSTPSDGFAPARTARLMGTLRGVWDQLASSLRNPKMPAEDLEIIAQAVAEESANVLKIVPKGNDPHSVAFGKLAQELTTRTRVLPRLVYRRPAALRQMALIETKLCMECHRVFRE